MSDYAPPTLGRERTILLVSLLALAIAGWVVVSWQAAQADMRVGGLTMGMGAPLFLAIWIAMMVAMMFPAAAPMVLMFAAISKGKQRHGQPFVPTWVFLLAYLLVWTLFGVLAYIAAAGIELLAPQAMWLMDIAPRIGGAILILAGLYQLSPLKNRCLTKCRSPLSYIMTSWRDGYAGAFRMGLEHGAYCLGCCWLLFVILFPLGVMNVAVMAVLTLLIFAEKSLPIGPRVAGAAAVALIAYGLIVIVVPGALPTAM